MALITSRLSPISTGVESTVDSFYKQVGLLVRYKDNIKDLTLSLSRLELKKTSVQYRVDEEIRNLSEIFLDVVHWLSRADDVCEQVTEFLQDKIKRNRNLKSRFVLSKKARQLNEQVLVLLEEPIDVDALGYRRLLFMSREKNKTLAGFQDGGSRISILNQALEALKDDEVSIISICGIEGVGKTVLAQELLYFVRERRLTEFSCMVTLSRVADLHQIQNDFAGWLGLQLDVESLEVRAVMLCKKIIEVCETMLLILDDVWEVVDLQKIGIPSAGEAGQIKILLTSRHESVCNLMESQRNFHVPLLTEDEARDLFTRTAFTENFVDDQDLHVLAWEIVNQCGGLPLIIVAMARGLKNESEFFWKDTLHNLQCYISHREFSRLQLTYDDLTSELRSCFLLCSLFPADSRILLEDLVRYGIHLGLFGDTDNFFRARERVHMLIHELKQSSMLLEGNSGDTVRMHDIVHKFSVSKDKSYVYCDGDKINSLNSDTLRSCTAMSLVCEEINERPVVFECPELQFLLFVSRRSSRSINCFFQGIKIGELGNLEILAIKTQTSVELPEEIGLLTNLKLLDLGGMSGLNYIPQGVLPKFSKLEELCVTPEFRGWGSTVEGEDGERINASLTELESLRITSLQISISKACILPKLSFFENLVQCEIYLGDQLLTFGKESEEGQFILEGDASHVKGSGTCALVKKCEELRLVRAENIKNIEHLFDTEQIRSSPDIQLQHISNLRYLAIEFCGDLKHAFPLSVATTLSQLQKIRINDCIRMEGILYGKGEVDGVQFPCLTNLELVGLQNLSGFWVDIDNAGPAGFLSNQFRVDDIAVKPSTPYFKGTSEIETESPLAAEIGRLELNFVLFPSWTQLSNLEELQLQGCTLLRVAFPSTVAEQLIKLKTLEIRWCWKMEYIVATVGRPQEKDQRSNEPKPVFPKLTSLVVDDLPELMAFSADKHFYLEWSWLEELKVSKCPKIKTLASTLPPDQHIRRDELLVSTNEILFKMPPQYEGSMNVKFLEVLLCDNLTHLFSSRAAKFLTGLERMEIKYCEKMKEVVAEEEDEEEECELTSLESVTFDGCFQLKTFSYNKSVNTPNLKDIHINGSTYKIIGNVNTTIKKVMSSESLIFDMKELETIEPVQIPYKDTILELEIQGCDKLMNAIPCNLIARLRKLEKLAVRWCDSLEEIFEYEGEMKFEEESDATFSHLQEITLFDLENLKHVFTRIPKTIIGFQKLRKLYVHGCHSLRNIFSVSSIRGLLLLQELKVSSCNRLEEVVAKEDKEEIRGRDKIVFPQLRNIDITNSASLESFCSGIYDLVMPLLESLHLNQCPSIKKFSHGSLTAPKLQKVQGDCKEISLIRTSPTADLDEIIAKRKKRTQLRVYNRKDLQNIGHDRLRYEDLSQIQDLEIQVCDQLLCAIPCNKIGNDLQKLEKLVVRRCHLLEEIFEHRRNRSESFTTISSLEEITLFDLGKLQHVFYDIPRVTIHFQKLRKLHIHGCDSLRNVFSVSTVQGLLDLQELKISSCYGLEEIVAGEKQERGMTDTKLVFPQLRSIDIGYSPKLVCFYSGNYGLEFPKLESVFLYKCPYMLTFSNGLLTTPSQLKLQIDNANYKLLEDGLNATMKYKDLLLQQDKESQGLEEHRQGSEFVLILTINS